MTDTSKMNDSEFLVKWVRRLTAHSPYLVVSADDHLAFAPHSSSILSNRFEIPYEAIGAILSSDNFFFRGAVDIVLKTDLTLELDLGMPNLPRLLSLLFAEQRMFSSKKIRLFLGNDRQRFLEIVTSKHEQNRTNAG